MAATSGRRMLLRLGATNVIVLAAPAFARDAKKKTEESISPPEDLMRTPSWIA